MAWCISAVETGYWPSEAAIRRHGNNLFGFKQNKRGFYAHIQNGYCRYAELEHSLADYGAYEQEVIAKYKLTTRAKYLNHIYTRYAAAPDYAGRIRLAFQRLTKIQQTA